MNKLMVFKKNKNKRDVYSLSAGDMKILLPGFNGSKNCEIFVGLCHPPQKLATVFGINHIRSPTCRFAHILPNME